MYAGVAPALLVYTDQHVIVDGDSVVARDEVWSARPIPASISTLERAGRVANVGVDLSERVGCGYADARYRVFCFDADWQLDAAAQLALLELARAPVRIRVGSEYGAYRVHAILAQVPERSLTAYIDAWVDPSCVGACAHRVLVERT